MKFVGKWMDLEKKNILSEVTQTQKDKSNTHSLIKWVLGIKQRKTNLHSTTQENLDNKEDPKRDIYGST